MAGASYVDALSNPLSMVVHKMFTEVGASSLGAEVRPVAGSVNAEIVAGTFKTLTMVASKQQSQGQTPQYLVQLLKFKVRYPLRQYLPRDLPLEPAWYSLQS